MVAVKNFDIGVVPFALGHSGPSGPAGGIFGANNFWFGIYNGTWHVAKGFAPTTGVWYHVTGTWDGSTSSLYVDGSLVASVPFVSAPLANPNEASIGAATRWGRSGHLFTFNGLIDEVELFNRALSLTEIQAIFNAGSAGKIHPLDIATLSLPAATAGEPYSQALITIGGTPPYSFSGVSGSLPAGLGLSSAGVISGTPTAVGTSTFTARVKDDLGQSDEREFSIGVFIPLTFIVNSTANGGDSDTTDDVCGTGGLNSEGVTECTLRVAIDQANARPVRDTIEFGNPDSDPGGIPLRSPDYFSIKPPSSQLPVISVPVIIDGYTQPGASPNTNGPGLGSNTVLKIELDGSIAGRGKTGLRITAGDSLVRGLAVNAWVALSSTSIVLSEKGGNSFEGNFIGLDITGTLFKGNAGSGITIENVPDNTIGGTTPEARNVFAGNQFRGVFIKGAGATRNVVAGNFFGTDAAGTSVIVSPGGSSSVGVVIGFIDRFGGQTPASDNTVGGTTPGARNLFGANSLGVQVNGSLSIGNVVQGNYFGVDPSGTISVCSGRGVVIVGARDTLIGGLDHDIGVCNKVCNLISPSGLSATVVSIGGGARGTLVQGNFIGTDPTDTAIPGGIGGIGGSTFLADGSTIGGPTPAHRNLISGRRTAIRLLSNRNIVQGNFLGTEVTGTSVPGPNVGDGVNIVGSDNLIGARRVQTSAERAPESVT